MAPCYAQAAAQSELREFTALPCGKVARGTSKRYKLQLQTCGPQLAQHSRVKQKPCSQPSLRRCVQQIFLVQIVVKGT